MSRRVFGSVGWSTESSWVVASGSGMSSASPRVACARRPSAGVGLAAGAGRFCRRGPPTRTVPDTCEGTGQHRDDGYGLVSRSGGDGIHRRHRQSVRSGRRRLSGEQPDHRLQSQGRGVRRRYPRHAARRRRDFESLLHRHQHRHVGRYWLRPGYVGRLQRQERRLRGADPQRVLPPHRRTGHAGQRRGGLARRNCRRRAGGHLVLLRPLRAEHLGHVARHGGRHSGQDHSRGAACPAATAQPHRHPRGGKRPTEGARTVQGQHRRPGGSPPSSPRARTCSQTGRVRCRSLLELRCRPGR